jgi:hypothetical protein
MGELFTIPEVSTHMAELLAGSDVRYDVGGDHPLSGRLVPELTLADGRRVAELLHDARPVLLDLTGSGIADAVPEWANRVDTVSATMADAPASAMLIRPDGYIAWAADAFGSAENAGLRTALRRWFGPASSG